MEVNQSSRLMIGEILNLGDTRRQEEFNSFGDEPITVRLGWLKLSA